MVPGKAVYENTGLTSAGIVLDAGHAHYIGQCLDPKSRYYRSWYCGLSHYVGPHEDTKRILEAGFAFVTKTPGEFWVGRYRDIVLYCMERDTHKLTSRVMGEGKYELTLTCEMDPAIYDFPLTVKVKIGEGAKGISAKQGEKGVEAKIVEHEGKTYGLVEVVPNGGAAVEVKGGG